MDTNKLLAYDSRRANPITIWLLFLFLGWSYGSLSKIGLQILYYITAGGLGIWTIIRLFTLNGAIKSYNRQIAGQVGLDNQEMATLNLLQVREVTSIDNNSQMREIIMCNCILSNQQPHWDI